MATECPRCRYVTQPGDANGDWECPCCGVIYAKYQARQQAATEALPTTLPKPAIKVPLGVQRQWVGVGLVLGIVILFRALLGFDGAGVRASCEGLRPAPIPASLQPQVVMYGTAWCGVCTQARDLMEHYQVPYQDLDVERDVAARRRFEELGGRGYPLIWVKGETMHGLDPDRLCGELERSGVMVRDTSAPA